MLSTKDFIRMAYNMAKVEDYTTTYAYLSMAKIAKDSTGLENKIEKAEYPCHILKKREIEFYYPIDVHIAAQQTNNKKEKATRKIYQGDQRSRPRFYHLWSGRHIH